LVSKLFLAENCLLQDIKEIKYEEGRVEGDGGKSKEEQDKKGKKWKGTRNKIIVFL
jgi:hypothetical protein